MIETTLLGLSGRLDDLDNEWRVAAVQDRIIRHATVEGLFFLTLVRLAFIAVSYLRYIAENRKTL